MYSAQILEVLIASPSDTDEQRQAIWRAIIDWNTTNARFRGVVLLPVMWETHSYPDLARPPQATLNKQIVDDADLLVATFWTTLGTPTPEARSGTIEEIERFRKAGKPVLLYFCERPAELFTVDSSGVDDLKAYREELKPQGLFSTYRTSEELRVRVRDDLTQLVHKKVKAGQIAPAPENEPERSGEPAGHDFEAMRRYLAGYAAKWGATVEGFSQEEIPSIDRRYGLATEVQTVLLETQRLVATDDPLAPVLQELVKLSSEAARLRTLRVYLDGGQSFNALNNGCKELVDEVAALTEDRSQWLVSSKT